MRLRLLVRLCVGAQRRGRNPAGCDFPTAQPSNSITLAALDEVCKHRRTECGERRARRADRSSAKPHHTSPSTATPLSRSTEAHETLWKQPFKYRVVLNISTKKRKKKVGDRQYIESHTFVEQRMQQGIISQTALNQDDFSSHPVPLSPCHAVNIVGAVKSRPMFVSYRAVPGL